MSFIGVTMGRNDIRMVQRSNHRAIHPRCYPFRFIRLHPIPHGSQCHGANPHNHSTLRRFRSIFQSHLSWLDDDMHLLPPPLLPSHKRRLSRALRNQYSAPRNVSRRRLDPGRCPDRQNRVLRPSTHRLLNHNLHRRRPSDNIKSRDESSTLDRVSIPLRFWTRDGDAAGGNGSTDLFE